MRWRTSIGTFLAAAVFAATPATGASAAGTGASPGPEGAAPAEIAAALAEASRFGSWVPAPQEAFEMPAGARCDFAVRVRPVVDEVRKLVLETYPDGAPKRELYTGALVNRVTNLETGATSLADASGTSLVTYDTDGSMTWYVVGPVLLGFRENAGSLPRGLWLVDGVFRVEFTPTYDKTITMVRGSTHDVCTDVA
ncbi:hypothetical protein AB0883_00150 [Micromonospora sp. NPDC047812]|uniref:hypothetical protein n=1 Tax=Micromonospora sp. NPDC047812 TaxID=3155742 RepID=UPI003453DC30